jgi:hypothetical protein
MITTNGNVHPNGTAAPAAPAGNAGGSGARTVRLRIRDVTSTHEAELVLDRSLRVGAVAETVAARMQLPADAAWALRNDATAAFLDDDAAIGDALGVDDDTEVFLTATPRAHLGAG